MKIIEEFIEGKNKNQSKCEDLIFKGKRFIAIIDGATSKNSIEFEGKSGGRVAAEIVFNSLQILDNNINITEPYLISEFIRKNFIPFYQEYNIDYIKEPTKRIVASVIIYDHLTKKIIQIGDCLGIIENNNSFDYLEKNKLIDEATSNTRALYLSTLIESKSYSIDDLLTNDKGREYINPLLEKQLIFQNKNIEFGYECFDGTEIPKEMIGVKNVPENSIIILSSDGYPKLFASLKESENYLKEILEEDPLLYKKYKTTKAFMKGQNSFDDRSYISFSN